MCTAKGSVRDAKKQQEKPANTSTRGESQKNAKTTSNSQDKLPKEADRVERSPVKNQSGDSNRDVTKKTSAKNVHNMLKPRASPAKNDNKDSPSRKVATATYGRNPSARQGQATFKDRKYVDDDSLRPPPPLQTVKRDIFGSNKKMPTKEDPEYQTLYALESWDNNGDNFSEYVKLVEQTGAQHEGKVDFSKAQFTEKKLSTETTQLHDPTAAGVGGGTKPADNMNVNRGSGETPVLKGSNEGTHKPGEKLAGPLKPSAEKLC